MFKRASCLHPLATRALYSAFLAGSVVDNELDTANVKKRWRVQPSEGLDTRSAEAVLQQVMSNLSQTANERHMPRSFGISQRKSGSPAKSIVRFFLPREAYLPHSCVERSQEKQKGKTKDTNLTEPDQSQKIAQTAKMKDAISDFIDAKCVLEDWRSVSQFGLYKCYRNFCTECDTDPLKLGKFNKIISKQYAESEYVCIVDGEPIKVWKGISFQEGVDPWA